MNLFILYLQSGFITPIPNDFALNYAMTIIKFWVLAFILCVILTIPFNTLTFLVAFILGDYSFFKEITYMYAAMSESDSEEDDTDEEY